MTKPQRKLFHQTMPGNYMPAGRDGCFVMLAFIAVAMLIVFIGELLSRWLQSPWPSVASWVLFVLVIIRFVLFAKRHS
ncbi:hypothetical protein [Paraurantiacibacter namhicola]|uniref:hypothetical protein n=1 Tax=Paraurantiacibacter namhicola TaxID=645517 RepID=UPI0012EE5BB7|nr:hypothetical protein [Paraurantiacibacter namhicola]